MKECGIYSMDGIVCTNVWDVAASMLVATLRLVPPLPPVA
jgi:hypothetical protein